jgi:hypothetical protein
VKRVVEPPDLIYALILGFLGALIVVQMLGRDAWLPYVAGIVVSLIVVLVSERQ